MYNVTDTYKQLIKATTRYTGLKGAVRLRDGSSITLTDSSVDSGSLQIVSKLNRRGDFRPGGVYSSEMSVSLRGFEGKTSDLDGAVIRLDFILYHDKSMNIAEAEVLPLGRFYADGSTIKRRNNVVSLSATDALTFFDIPAEERTGTLYELALGACDRAGVSFGMTQAEFEALPNGTLSATVNTARIQTERDLLMYIGMTTGSFSRIRREDNALEFRALSCEKTDGGVIIPVREIAGNIRFTTDFSDDTTRIAQLVTRRNGAPISSTTTITPGGSEKLVSLELDSDPLLEGLSDSAVQSALNAQLGQLYQCLNRVFDADFTGDPALDTGDYVRLRGGAIDTDRGYATGMITSQTWRYRGRHTIRCNMPSSITPVAETAQAAAMALADTAETAGGETVSSSAQFRIQPRSQTEKQIDELAARSGVATKLISPDGNSWASVQNAGNITLFENNSDTPWGYITPNHTGISLGTTDGRYVTLLSNTIEIYCNGNRVYLSGSGDGGTINLQSGNTKLNVNGGSIVTITQGGINITGSTGISPMIVKGVYNDYGSTQGFQIKCGSYVLEAKSDGLYYNGVKIGG